MTTLPIPVNMGTREVEIVAFELTSLVRLIWSTGLDTIPPDMLDYLRNEVLQAISRLRNGYPAPEFKFKPLLHSPPQFLPPSECFKQPASRLVNSEVVSAVVDGMIEYTMTVYKPNVKRLLTEDTCPDYLLDSQEFKITVARDLFWLLKSRMGIEKYLW